jgi:hypothetical protein
MRLESLCIVILEPPSYELGWAPLFLANVNALEDALDQKVSSFTVAREGSDELLVNWAG